MHGPFLRLPRVAIQFFQVLEQPLDVRAERAGQFVGTVFDEIRNPRCDVANTLRHDEAELAEQPADLVGLRWRCAHKPLADLVQCQHRLLLDGLQRHEAHACRSACL